MARPQKIGLDYFPFDVDFFADRKIKVLFARFGCEGVAFYLYILCEIYRDKGFFVQCDDEFLEVASAELQIPREKLLRLLKLMAERELIHGGLLKEKGVLTSRGVQLRYQRAKDSAGRKTPISVRKELWLLNGRETSAFIQARGEEAAGKKSVGAAGKNPPEEQFQADGSKASEGMGKDFLCQEVSFKEKQCVPVENSGGKNPQRKEKKKKEKEKGEALAEETAKAFRTVPPTLKNDIRRFLEMGAPESLIRYAAGEAGRLGKPYSYMAAIVRQRMAEGRLDVEINRRAEPSYDLEEFEKLGFHVPKLPGGAAENQAGAGVPKEDQDESEKIR